MLETMILYVIYERDFSMYSILKRILEIFGDFSTPSFGAIRPALTKLEKEGCIKSQKILSEGGKQTGYYSITNEGKKFLKHKILEELPTNPVQFKSNCTTKIVASEILQKDEQQEVFEMLLRQTELHKLNAEKKLKDFNRLTDLQKVLITNRIKEYENYMSFLNNLKNNL